MSRPAIWQNSVEVIEDGGGSAKEHFGRRIGEPQALAGQVKTVGRDAAPALGVEPVHLGGPFAAEIVAGGVFEFVERPARDQAQPKRGRLPGARERREFLARFN